MSGGRRKGPKVAVQGARPEPPSFIAKMREKIVAKESVERQERSDKRRRDQMERGYQDDGDDEDTPRVVKLSQEDMTEEEYKRLKLEMETSYKITDTRARSSRVDLDIDAMIQTSGLASDNQRESKSTHKETNSSSRSTGDDNLKKRNDKEEEQRCSKANRDETTPRKTQQASKSKSKTLSYGDSSSSSDSEA